MILETEDSRKYDRVEFPFRQLRFHGIDKSGTRSGIVHDSCDIGCSHLARVAPEVADFVGRHSGDFACGAAFFEGFGDE